MLQNSKLRRCVRTERNDLLRDMDQHLIYPILVPGIERSIANEERSWASNLAGTTRGSPW